MKFLVLIIILCSELAFAADGVFMVVKGKVRVENQKNILEARVGTKVQEGDTIVTEKDSRAKIVMSDRNIINVSPETKFKIAKYTNSQEDKNVQLNLIEGKIRNNVEEKYDNKNSKFEVRTATAVAGVRGTQFITSYDKLTKITEVVTLKGQVSLKTLLVNGKANEEAVVINKGEKSQAQEGKETPPAVKLPEKEIEKLDMDTNVKGKKSDNPALGGAPAPGLPPSKGAPDDKQPPPAGDQLGDLNRGNGQIKNGAATRKFDRSKVRIITQPSN